MIRQSSFYLVFAVLAGAGFLREAAGDSWRVGDRQQPWTVHPVSFTYNIGPGFRPDFTWGGGNAVEVVVDDDGDGLVDEDPVNLVDDDGDGLLNEDPPNGIDDDRDGLVDEDGADAQFDDDGDGLLNEDGLMTGDLIFDETIREGYKLTPFFRDPPEYGDDDYDGRFNEDPPNGIDDDGDGLVDEDDRFARPLPANWSRQVFSYEAPEGADPTLAFIYDAERGLFEAVSAAGDTVVARSSRFTFNPTDWIRPIRLDSTRNVIRLSNDRFLSGEFGPFDPINLFRGAVRTGESGHGQVVDGNIFTAKGFVQRGGGLGTGLGGLFWIDRVRYYPRPDFPDRSPANFAVWFGGDHANDFRRFSTRDGALEIRFVRSRFLVPQVVDQARPVIKNFEIDPPQRVRSLSLSSTTAEGVSWELAEAEAFGHGFSLEASYVTEVIDVGTSTPRFRRYFEEEDASRSKPFESFLTVDVNRNDHIDEDELAATKLAGQFDPDLPGKNVTWGRVRWRGQVEGRGGNVQIRARAGTALDTRVYLRLVTQGVTSPFIDRPLILDWPEVGARIDAITYAALNATLRVTLGILPYNTLGDGDGAPGGWSFWSAPFSFESGLVDENGEGGVLLVLPPLTRYIQFRLDFESDEDSGVFLDYLEFDFNPPFVERGVVAEIFPDTTSQLGVATSYQYALKPEFGGGDIGFNRIELAVPSEEARVESLVVDGLVWEGLGSPAGVGGRAWLDTVHVTEVETFASVAYLDSASGQVRLGIKTALLQETDFPRGLDRDIQIYFRTPVFSLLTRFDSWVWNDRDGDVALQQSVQEGNVLDELPADGVAVTVGGVDRTMGVRSVGPNPFTPNGDGVNDRVEFAVDVFLITQQTTVTVEIFALSGERVQVLEMQALRAGLARVSWDGRDDGGELVVPGVYAYRVAADSDVGSQERVGVVAVAY